ncbi:MAG: efflux RND transporter periplasmic adaptor subunit [Pyrinomonadaceae bacterium]
MFSRDKIKIIVFVIATVLSGTALVSCGGSRAQTNKKEGAAANAPTPAPAVDVTVAPAIVRSLPRFIEATGSLAADEQTDVAPTVGGRVTSVGVDLGSYVQKGQVIVRLDDADARLRVEQAQSQLEQSQAAIRQAEARIGLRTGQRFDPTRVAEVGAAKAALDLAEKQLRRFETLIESGDVSRSSYDQQKAQRDQLRQQYEAQLTAAQQNYAAINTARAASQTSAVAVSQAQKGVRDAVVYAPISGFVSERTADVGEYVSTSTKVATIVRTNPMRVRIDIPEQSISNIRPGQSVSVSVSDFPERSFAGTVARISPNVTATSRTLTVEAEVGNGDGVLKPGQFVTVRILLPQSDPAILVPARAVRTEANTSRVYVIRDGVAQERLVQLGQTEGELIEIKGNLAEGETVATGNVEQLSDGALVRQ